MNNIKINSKLIKKGDIFICIHDDILDRHIFINDAVKNKASLVVVDKNIKDSFNIPILYVNNTNETYYNTLNNYYNYPFNKLKLIGITGTDGKTTTSEITYNLLNKYMSTSYLGTNGFYYNDKKISTNNTTPSLEDIFKYSNTLNKNNISTLIMETSSEGLLHNRCYNLSFDIGVLTNITSDHLNVHKSFNNYLNSKLKLFKQVKKDGTSILNKDDKYYRIFKKACNKIITYGTKKSTYQIKNIKYYEKYTTYNLIYNKKKYYITSPYIGKFNVYNLTCAIAITNTLVNDLDKIIKNIYNLKPISGRLNNLDYKQDYKIYLDYAHTINGTYEILSFMNKIKKNRIISVAGCAGGRDKSKRKDIGYLLSKYSDITIFTMDDPRYEKVKNIFKDMLQNVTKDNYLLIENRKKAIYKALSIAKKDDIVLILGKGTDNYMAINNKYIKYNDLKTIKKYFRYKKIRKTI